MPFLFALFVGFALFLVAAGLSERFLGKRLLPLRLPDSSNLPKNAKPYETMAACVLWGARYGIDPRLLFYTAFLESRLVPTAIGDNGASFGLTQLQRVTVETIRAAGYTVSDDWEFGINGNVEAAAEYSAWLADRFDISDAGRFRELWTLGPTKYRAGMRNETEAAKMMELYT